jgi:hypothetical protein
MNIRSMVSSPKVFGLLAFAAGYYVGQHWDFNVALNAKKVETNG